eukprot:SAG11_NODE_274_length_11310_cov_4.717510_9_plen_171_part_00
MSCHQLQYLSLADKVLLIDKQTIQAVGSYHELRAQMNGGLYEQFFSHCAEIDGKHHDTTREFENCAEGVDIQGKDTKVSPEDENPPSSDIPPTTTTLINAEERTNGTVELDVYLDYAKQFGSLMFITVALCFGAAQFLQVLSDWWMGRWSDMDTSYVLGYNDSWSREKIL